MISVILFLLSVSSVYASSDFTYFQNAGVCFNESSETGFNTKGDKTECRDYRERVLVGKSFEKQSLQGSSFETANLARANFSGADIRGVDFRDANLKDAVFAGAKYDRFTKGDSDLDLKSKGAIFVGDNISFEVGKAFRDLVVNVIDGHSTLVELDKFLTMNPSLNIESELDYINRDRPETAKKVTNYLAEGNFAFFDILLQHGFRFDLEFTYYPDAKFKNRTNYLRTALRSNKNEVLDYVLNHYSPYQFKRTHLVALLKDMTPATLDLVIERFPNLLTDPSEPNYYFEDPIKASPNPKILRRLLELNIPRNPKEEEYYWITFKVNFENTLDFGWLDIPIAYGFDFSQDDCYWGIGGINGSYRHFNHKNIPDLSHFLLELKKRTLSKDQPHGLRVLQEDEIFKLSRYLDSHFAFGAGHYPDSDEVQASINLLRTYLATFQVKSHGEIVAGFLDSKLPLYYWKNPEFETALRVVIELDPEANYLPLMNQLLSLSDIYSSTNRDFKLPEEYERMFALVSNKLTPEQIQGSPDAKNSILSVIIANSRFHKYDWPFVKLMIERFLKMGADPNRGKFIEQISEMVNYDNGLSLLKDGTVEPIAFWNLLNSGPIKIAFNQTDKFARIPPSAAFVKFVTGAEEYVGLQKSLDLLNQYKNQIDWKIQIDGKSRLLDFAKDHKYYNPSKALLDEISRLVGAE